MKLRLKIIRKVNNYTQNDMAKLLGVTQRTYSKYETGELSLKLEQLVALSNFYKLTTDYILGIASDSQREQNYSQRQLAELINCSPSLISMIELKKSGIQLDTLMLLASVYNKTVDEILFGK